MIKILKAPLQLEPFLDEFKDLFTKPSYRSFRDLCAALSVCDKSKTVANLCDTMADCRKGKIVANGPYILHVIDLLEYHLFYPFFILARSSMISTYCLTKDLLISSSEAIFSAGIPSL